MNETILVTEPEFRKAEDTFRAAAELRVQPAPPEEEQLAEAVGTHRARAAIVGIQPYSGRLFEALAESGPSGGAILARFGVGHDSVDKAAARRHGVVVTNTPGVLDASVAEHAMWLLGCLARHVAGLDARIRAGQFAGTAGIELCGKRLGIVGFGAIGRRVAAIAHRGFGMPVLAADSRSIAALESQEQRSWTEIQAAYGLELYTGDADEVFREADAVSIHLPAAPATRNFVDARRLGMMRPGALLVNTARGSILDEAALYDALAARQIAGAGLDVFAREPYDPVCPGKDLRTLENALLTPHVGSNTCEANRRMAEASLANVRHFLTGQINRLSRVDVPEAE